jgi:hypothetical protein
VDVVVGRDVSCIVKTVVVLESTGRKFRPVAHCPVAGGTVRLKLRRVAKAFYSAQSHLKDEDISYEDISYEEFQAAFVNRFRDKQTDQYHYARLRNASQDKNESPEMYFKIVSPDDQT